MKRIYIDGEDSNQIFDVSSDDKRISGTVSATIQSEFSEASRQLGEFIRKRVEKKESKDDKVTDNSVRNVITIDIS
jgi:hypothetical protein